MILGISVLAMAGILWGNGKEVETQRETAAACQRFAVSCQWTVLGEDEAKQMDETWYQFSEGAVSLEYPDYFDLDFRCADYVGEGLLVMNPAKRGEEGPYHPYFPELAWGYRIFTKEGRVFGISEAGVEEYSFFPIPSLLGIELF